MGEQVNQLWYIHAMEESSATTTTKATMDTHNLDECPGNYSKQKRVNPQSSRGAQWVKDLWLSLLWVGFNIWPGNFPMLKVCPPPLHPQKRCQSPKGIYCVMTLNLTFLKWQNHGDGDQISGHQQAARWQVWPWKARGLDGHGNDLPFPGSVSTSWLCSHPRTLQDRGD